MNAVRRVCEIENILVIVRDPLKKSELRVQKKKKKHQKENQKEKEAKRECSLTKKGNLSYHWSFPLSKFMVDEAPL